MSGFCSGVTRKDILSGGKEHFRFCCVLLAINVMYKISEREGFYHFVLRLNTVIQKDGGEKDWQGTVKGTV